MLFNYPLIQNMVILPKYTNLLILTCLINESFSFVFDGRLEYFVKGALCQIRHITTSAIKISNWKTQKTVKYRTRRENHSFVYYRWPILKIELTSVINHNVNNTSGHICQCVGNDDNWKIVLSEWIKDEWIMSNLRHLLI